MSKKIYQVEVLGKGKLKILRNLELAKEKVMY